MNDKATTLDAAPFTSGGRTMVPLRFVAEAAGCTVEWIGAENRVEIRRSAGDADTGVESNNLETVTVKMAERIEELTAATVILKTNMDFVATGGSEVFHMNISEVENRSAIDGEEFQLSSESVITAKFDDEKYEQKNGTYIKGRALYQTIDGEIENVSVLTSNSEIVEQIESEKEFATVYNLLGNTAAVSKTDLVLDGKNTELVMILNTDYLNRKQADLLGMSTNVRLYLDLLDTKAVVLYNEATAKIQLDEKMMPIHYAVEAKLEVIIEDVSVFVKVDMTMDMTKEGDAVVVTYPDIVTQYEWMEHIIQ